MVNEQALRLAIMRKYRTITQFANVLKRTYPTVHSKLTNKSAIFLDEAETWQKLLEIPDDKFTFYFFNRLEDD